MNHGWNRRDSNPEREVPAGAFSYFDRMPDRADFISVTPQTVVA